MKKILYLIASILAVAVSWFAYYAISPLFRHVRVDEAAPQAEMSEETISEKIMSDEEKSVEVIGTSGHPASGTARIIEANGKKYIRYENFTTINGPDLYVYLAKDLDAEEFVSLGTLRATEGNVNYEIPSMVNPSDYRYVLTWCKQFGVLFNYAEISNAE